MLATALPGIGHSFDKCSQGHSTQSQGGRRKRKQRGALSRGVPVRLLGPLAWQLLRSRAGRPPTTFPLAMSGTALGPTEASAALQASVSNASTGVSPVPSLPGACMTWLAGAAARITVRAGSRHPRSPRAKAWLRSGGMSHWQLTRTRSVGESGNWGGGESISRLPQHSNGPAA